MSSYSDVDQCISDWCSGAITRSEVIVRLLGFPTLEAQCLLLSQLPEFVSDAKESLRYLSPNSGDWMPGAHVPYSGKRSKEEERAFQQQLVDAKKSLQQLHDYLFRISENERCTGKLT